MGFHLVSVDLDGTLLPRTTTFSFLSKKLGFYEAMKRFDEQFHRGELTWEECITRQFRLMKGIRVSDAHTLMDEMPKIQNIHEAVGRLKEAGLIVVLLTDNPDVLADYFVKFGFQRVIGSEARIEDGYITGELRPLTDKSRGLAHFLSQNALTFDKCVHVGDWFNDIPVFQKVGYSIALNARHDRVRESASHCMDTDTLLDIAEHILSLK